MTIQVATSEPLKQQHIEAHHSSDVSTAFQQLVDEQSQLSRDQLSELHKQWLGPHGIFATFSAEVERLGRQAPALDDLCSLGSAERTNEAERAVAFALAQSNRRRAANNPFGSRSRQDLCCVVFNETGAYTLAERYAAYEAMRQSDSDFFIKLIATTRGVTERRIVFRGLLEHYDRLLPIEKASTPKPTATCSKRIWIGKKGYTGR
ncbi:hypothetical protein [Pseudomonas sp. 15A4]|uniref:hypothetical protein n=1 Tax=Pseudomonas sp. 15A4 TaxID=2804761 RepID=UPI001F07506E|nr:hypothetical protein [Pseudomonas sp. 15A4]